VKKSLLGQRLTLKRGEPEEQGGCANWDHGKGKIEGGKKERAWKPRQRRGEKFGGVPRGARVHEPEKKKYGRRERPLKPFSLHGVKGEGKDIQKKRGKKGKCEQVGIVET